MLRYINKMTALIFSPYAADALFSMR